jgi:hypothetical protein
VGEERAPKKKKKEDEVDGACQCHGRSLGYEMNHSGLRSDDSWIGGEIVVWFVSQIINTHLFLSWLAAATTAIPNGAGGVRVPYMDGRTNRLTGDDRTKMGLFGWMCLCGVGGCERFGAGVLALINLASKLSRLAGTTKKKAALPFSAFPFLPVGGFLRYLYLGRMGGRRRRKEESAI